MAIYKIICRTAVPGPAEDADVKIAIEEGESWRGLTDEEGAFLREIEDEEEWDAFFFANDWQLIEEVPPQQNPFPMGAPGVHTFNVEAA